MKFLIIFALVASVTAIPLQFQPDQIIIVNEAVNNDIFALIDIAPAFVELSDLPVFDDGVPQIFNSEPIQIIDSLNLKTLEDDSVNPSPVSVVEFAEDPDVAEAPQAVDAVQVVDASESFDSAPADAVKIVEVAEVVDAVQVVEVAEVADDDQIVEVAAAGVAGDAIDNVEPVQVVEMADAVEASPVQVVEVADEVEAAPADAVQVVEVAEAAEAEP